MGGMLPSVAMSAVQMGLETAQQNRAEDAAKQQARAQAEQLQEAQSIASQQRQDQLRRALASQRARFAAQGIAPDTGSADATLGGLEADAAQADANAQSLTDLRVGNLYDSLSQRRNLLDASDPRYRTAFSLLQRSLRSVPLLDG
jgi:hypothetical protein